MGGKKWRVSATILPFIANGLIHHSIFYMLSGQWSFTIPVLFMLLGICTAGSRTVADYSIRSGGHRR